MTDISGENMPAFGKEMLSEFMLRGDVTFLNHASYGGTPKVVHERQVEYLREIERHTDFWYRFNYPEYLKAAVRKVSDFIGIDAEDTILLQNVTKAINTILKTFPLQSGDAILLTTLTYGANRCIARAACERVPGSCVQFLEIKFPIKSEYDIVAKYEEFLQEHPEVKIAVVDHITSPTAMILPVQRLIEVCHRHDVIVVVDGANVPGLLKAGVIDIDADFYTGNLHKWLFTPHSCAFLWMNPTRRHAWFKPLVTSAYEYDGIHKAVSYEGTCDNTAYLCAMDGIDFYNRLGGMEKIIQYTKTLKERGVAYLEDSWKTKRLDFPCRMAAPNIQMIRVPPLPKFKNLTNLGLLRLLAERFGVQVALEYVEGEMCLRVSVQVYNTMEDFVKLGQAVLTLAKEK